VVKSILKFGSILFSIWLIGGITVAFLLTHLSGYDSAKIHSANYTLEVEPGLKIRGTHYQQRNEHCVVLLHGIRSSRAAMRSRVDYYLAKGFDCLSLDLRAHGSSEGSFTSFGWNESDDLLAVYLDLKTEYKSIAVHGCSLGAATILYSARYELPYRYVVLESPYDNIDHAFRHRMNDLPFPHFSLSSLRWGLFVFTGVTADKLNTVKAARQLKCPSLHLAGTQENQIPLHESEELFKAINSTLKRKYWFEGAKHQDLYRYNDTLYQQVVNDFLDEVYAHEGH